MLKRKKNSKVTISYHSLVLFIRDINLSGKFYRENYGLDVEMDIGKVLSFTEGLSLLEIPEEHEIIARFGQIPSETTPNHK